MILRTLAPPPAAMLLTVLLTAAVVSARAEPPPISDYTRFSEYETARLSPSGRRIAITRRTKEFESLNVLDVDTLEILGSSHFGRRVRIDRVFWATDERLLVQPAQRFGGYTDGHVPTGEIIGMDADGKGTELLFGFRAGMKSSFARRRWKDSPELPGRVIDVLPDDEDHVVVQSMGWDFKGEFNRAYQMHLRTGRLSTLARAPVRNGDFVTAADHSVALVSGLDNEGSTNVWYLEGESGAAEPIHRESRDGFLQPVAAWPDADIDTDVDTDVDAEGAAHPRFLVLERVKERQRGATLGLAIWTPATGALEALARHPDIDVDSWSTDAQGRVFAARFLDDYPSWIYPDETHPLARLHAALVASNPGDDVQILDVSEDGGRAVARLHGPRRPGTFLVLDVRQPAVLRRLGSRPWHVRDVLADMQPFQVQARDGLLIRGYLSRSPTAPEGPRPTVVLVHGGPHGIHDRWDFDPEVQLLASRGYTVMQVNFRGSGGRGQAFEEAGHGRWGAAMQDDVTDAVRWAIEAGHADPQRICIMGASYGAYAALTGAFREPELFRCAVGLAGVYDLELMFDKGDIRTSMKGQAYLEEILGDDPVSLRRRSPVHNAEHIRAAVLLAHGDLDERAPIEHALRMRKALRRAGNPPVWIRERQEGHGFVAEGNRRDYWEEVLAFLDEHIGQAAPSENRVAR